MKQEANDLAYCEITSIGIDEIFIYDYKLGRCLSMEYVTKTKPFLPTAWR